MKFQKLLSVNSIGQGLSNAARFNGNLSGNRGSGDFASCGSGQKKRWPQVATQARLINTYSVYCGVRFMLTFQFDGHRIGFMWYSNLESTYFSEVAVLDCYDHIIKLFFGASPERQI